MLDFVVAYFMAGQECFLPLVAHVHRHAKMITCKSVQFLKRNRCAIFKLFYYQCSVVRLLAFLYVYYYAGYTSCYILDKLWLLFKVILLSGDIETNLDPDTLDFCTWNLNSITANYFLRVALLEAYNTT